MILLPIQCMSIINFSLNKLCFDFFSFAYILSFLNFTYKIILDILLRAYTITCKALLYMVAVLIIEIKNLNLLENRGYNNKFGFLIVKRLIIGMYQNSFIIILHAFCEMTCLHVTTK